MLVIDFVNPADAVALLERMPQATGVAGIVWKRPMQGRTPQTSRILVLKGDSHPDRKLLRHVVRPGNIDVTVWTPADSPNVQAMLGELGFRPSTSESPVLVHRIAT